MASTPPAALTQIDEHPRAVAERDMFLVDRDSSARRNSRKREVRRSDRERVELSEHFRPPVPGYVVAALPQVALVGKPGRREFAESRQDLVYLKQPTFHIMVLFVDESESVARQLK